MYVDIGGVPIFPAQETSLDKQATSFQYTGKSKQLVCYS